MQTTIRITPSEPAWTTLAVEGVKGWANVFDLGGRRIAQDSPGVLLQQSTKDGRQRTVFAAICSTGELVAATDAVGYVETVSREDIRLYGLRAVGE